MVTPAPEAISRHTNFETIRRRTPLERTGDAVHAAQPPPLDRTYVIRQQVSPKKRRQIANSIRKCDERLSERWLRWCGVLQRKFGDSAELSIIYHYRTAWELWLCGWDCYDRTVWAWWIGWDAECRFRFMQTHNGHRMIRREMLRRMLNQG